MGQKPRTDIRMGRTNRQTNKQTDKQTDIHDFTQNAPKEVQRPSGHEINDF